MDISRSFAPKVVSNLPGFQRILVCLDQSVIQLYDTLIEGPQHMRINARLDEDHQRKLEYLMRVSGLRVSDIVKQAIDVLYERAKQTGGRPEGLLTRSGFIGCSGGPEDLSVSYKDELEASIRSKHGHR